MDPNTIADQINQVVNNLATRITPLTSEVIRQYRIQHMVGAVTRSVFTLVTTILSIVLFCRARRLGAQHEFYPVYVMFGVFAIIVTMISCAFLVRDITAILAPLSSILQLP